MINILNNYSQYLHAPPLWKALPVTKFHRHFSDSLPHISVCNYWLGVRFEYYSTGALRPPQGDIILEMPGFPCLIALIVYDFSFLRSCSFSSRIHCHFNAGIQGDGELNFTFVSDMYDLKIANTECTQSNLDVQFKSSNIGDNAHLFRAFFGSGDGTTRLYPGLILFIQPQFLSYKL